MQQFIILLLKSIACSGILFAYYLLFLRNKKLHNYNRFYLLAATIISITIPFLEFKYYVLTPASSSGVVLLNAISMDKEYEVISSGTVSIISIEMIVQYCYSAMSIFLFVMLLARIVWIYLLKRNGTTEQKEGYSFILTDSEQAPFSFLNNLFWKRNDNAESIPGKQIIAHELCHIRQLHTLDKLFMQVVICIAWANPFFWLIRKELAMQHEFIADDAAISNNDTDAFARMILQASYTNVLPDIIHPFFHSSIKRRLIMLTHSKKTTFSYMRRLMLLPLAGILLILFSFKLDVPKVNRANKRISVVFDAGHGGRDDGATGPNGIKEKDLTLRICNKLAQLSPEYNIHTLLTRKDDRYLVLNDRVSLSESMSPDIFVNIHVNSSKPGNSTNGYEVISSTSNPHFSKSRDLALAISTHMHLPDTVTLLHKGLIVLKENSKPAVAIECGDIHNPKHLSTLTDDDKLEQFCREILSGIADYQNAIATSEKK